MRIKNLSLSVLMATTFFNIVMLSFVFFNFESFLGWLQTGTRPVSEMTTVFSDLLGQLWDIWERYFNSIYLIPVAISIVVALLFRIKEKRIWERGIKSRWTIFLFPMILLSACALKLQNFDLRYYLAPMVFICIGALLAAVRENRRYPRVLLCCLVLGGAFNYFVFSYYAYMQNRDLGSLIPKTIRSYLDEKTMTDYGAFQHIVSLPQEDPSVSLAAKLRSKVGCDDKEPVTLVSLYHGKVSVGYIAESAKLTAIMRENGCQIRLSGQSATYDDPQLHVFGENIDVVNYIVWGPILSNSDFSKDYPASSLFINKISKNKELVSERTQFKVDGYDNQVFTFYIFKIPGKAQWTRIRKKMSSCVSDVTKC